MKILIVFYSRTGATKKVAEELSKRINCETVEIFDIKNRAGVIGYLMAGRDAMTKKLTEIKPIEKNLVEYDLVVVGTPVWAFTVSTPARTFLENYKKDFKKLAFFCTMGGSGDKGAFTEMEKASHQTPVATLSLTTKEAQQGGFAEKLEKFIEEINR
jgi:flavodoxin